MDYFYPVVILTFIYGAGMFIYGYNHFDYKMLLP